MNVTYEDIRSKLIRMDALMGDLTPDEIAHAPERIYQSHLAGLNRLAATPMPDEILDELALDEGLVPVVKRIARVRRLIGLKLEMQLAKSIKTHADPQALLRTFTYYPNYLSLARMEYGGAKLRSGDRVVFLGSGPLPLSLICLAREYGVQGVGIEQDPQIAELSKNVVQKLALDNHISILQGNHFLLPLENSCALIMVGADAVPKNDIFDHLARVFPPGQKISCRIYEKGLRRLLDDQSMFRLPAAFAEQARVRPEPPVNNTCVFAVRVG